MNPRRHLLLPQIVLSALLALAACDGKAGSDDNDGDGHAAGDDCDDADSATYPGADELCDGLDNDGNGSYELLVGASGDETGSPMGGGAFLFNDVSAGSYTTADADTWFSGDVASANAGVSAFMGDLNGDERDDVAIGAYNDSTGALSGGGVFVQYARE